MKMLLTILCCFLPALFIFSPSVFGTTAPEKITVGKIEFKQSSNKLNLANNYRTIEYKESSDVDVLSIWYYYESTSLSEVSDALKESYKEENVGNLTEIDNLPGLKDAAVFVWQKQDKTNKHIHNHVNIWIFKKSNTSEGYVAVLYEMDRKLPLTTSEDAIQSDVKKVLEEVQKLQIENF